MKHLFIINPVAGGKNGNAGKLESEIREFAQSLDDPYEIYLTKAPMDASEKIAEEASSADMLYVYACGGDGTLNECANGAAKRANVAITHYPSGTGNDFIRTFGQSNTQKFRDLRALAEGHVRPLDLIDCGGRYGINICSVGIDARVGNDVHKYSRIPVIGGATGYVVSLIVNVIKGVRGKFRISTEDTVLEKEITLVCACNGKFYGGGFNPVPEADPGDGILEYLIIDGVSRLKIAQIVGKYAKGRYREIKKVMTYLRGSRMEIESEREFVVNIDGEIIKTAKTCFNLVPGGVNFIFPSGVE
ncbi:MAG: YegS/Rv2252/BmrU family lipid kinase [Oscillospiraceae bacterium]|jgi:YegS/Rv2252/BmrU family lipid kinase|nr:YegS/Rv2252/BmrU family lipid kinase [Oscillospiraceae bacterium]